MKKGTIWSVTWKTLLALVLTGILALIGIVLDEYFHSWEFRHRHTRQSIYTEYLNNSTSIKLEKKSDKYFRLIDAQTGKALTPKLDYIYTGTVKDSLTVFIQKGCRGYLNIYTGKIVLPAQWQHAWVFSEGLGAVAENNRLGFIDHQGNWVIRPQFAVTINGAEHVFKNGLCTMKDTCGYFGIINTTGEWVFRPEYRRILPAAHQYRILQNKDNQYGLIDSLGKVLLPCEYSNIDVTDHGVTLTQKGRRWMVTLDLKTVVHPFLIDGQNTFTVYTNQYDADGDRISYEYQAIGYYYIGEYYGLLNRATGQPITPAIYDEVSYVSNNLFECNLPDSESDASVLVNARGEEVK